MTAGHCVDPGEEGARDTALRFAVQWLIRNGWGPKSAASYLLNEAHLTWGVEGTEKGSPPLTDATYEPTYKDGRINSKKTREGGLLPVYEISAAMSGGMSGGPTVNMDGEVVGVNSFGIVGETEAFNFITPVTLVREMLARNGVSNELGPVDRTYRAGLEAFFEGDYRAAIERFDQVLALSPTHQQAQEFRVEAAKRAAASPEPEPGKGTAGVPVGLVGAIGGGVVLLAALAFVASRRRRPVPEARFCPSCGHLLEAGARFCPSCGHRAA